MRISALFYRVIVCLAILSACAFAQTVAIAHIIYDGNVLYYADNESNFVYKSLEKARMGRSLSNSPKNALPMARKTFVGFSSAWAAMATRAIRT